MKNKILAIDDDPVFLKSLKKLLTMRGYYVDLLSDTASVLDHFINHDYNCVLLDVKMPGTSGLDLLKNMIRVKPNIPIVMVSGQSNIHTAVDSLKSGAFDFIEKPLNPERLFLVIEHALQKHELLLEKETLFKELHEQNPIIYRSEVMGKILNQVEQIASTNTRVLILGESGTGKELIAWALHHFSDRSGKPYIKINCAAIPRELLESELFGYKKGAFTGAISDRQGKFVAADGGTLFLDEIGEMDLMLQAKLLRVIEDNEVEVIGENFPRKVNVRLIAASNKNLTRLSQEGKFRNDLYHRLDVVKIEIPPLRERVEDILPLAYHYLKVYNDQYNKQITGFSRQAEAVLINHRWPGNVRELKNVIEKLVIFSTRKQIGIEDVQQAIEKDFYLPHTVAETNSQNIQPLREARADFEKKYILLALEKFNWKVSRVAEALKIDRSHLFKKMARLGLKNKN